jgi:hypothetical protein
MDRSLRLALLTLLLATPLVAPASGGGDPFPMDRTAQFERFRLVLTYWCGQSDRRYGISQDACLSHVQARLQPCVVEAALPDRLYGWGDFGPVAKRYDACTEPAARRHRPAG